MAKVINIGVGGGNSDAELVTNKTTVINEDSTNIQYPSAKAVYDFVNGVVPSIILNDCSWEQISNISATGLGSAYFDIGDTKAVALKGTVGTLALDTILYVFILGFNHNSDIEGSGISFGCFKSALKDGKDVALVDSKYASYSRDGTKAFNMNHWTTATSGADSYGFNYGGWKGCDLRYDVLGSTDKQPSGYTSQPVVGRIGYDASTTTATNPVKNTLMAALPSELRAVLKPITKYSDNVGNEAGDGVASSVSSSVDYLPLLDEYEIFGGSIDDEYDHHCANNVTWNYQKQYDYYANGNSKVRYKHSSTGSTVWWWERSPDYGYADDFCYVYSNGYPATYYAARSGGLAPAFLV